MLTLREVSAGYGSFQALSRVTLEVQPGEAVAVIGPNGAGKTTLMRVISGLLPPWSGELDFEGRPLSSIARHKVVDAGIAHVPENRRLFPGLTVEENLKMGAYNERSRGRFRARLAEVYELFPRLRERRGQIAGTLSGGEQQMCAIGRALMSEPRLLLLDEPSAGLAPLVVKQVFDLIQKIRKEGYTVLIVEQNVYQVLRVVARAYLLETGSIRASGSAAELMRSDEVRKAYMGI